MIVDIKNQMVVYITVSLLIRTVYAVPKVSTLEMLTKVPCIVLSGKSLKSGRVAEHCPSKANLHFEISFDV